ncbi:DUF3857 domain-containing protein [Persicobacter diffluens]|uniref:DUF3857 domain-containing protein n=1 Tax=Persicobacter diffluens TaxID=981 RepID=A0AAN4W1A7_9BACT|nr:hypothetical protein PEDI_33450 [Persicobacter diffluens]
MSKLFVTFLFFCSSFYNAFAQLSEHHNINWEISPKLHPLDEQYQQESAIIIKDERVIELVPVQMQAVSVNTVHKIIKIMDESAIENYNKVYIPYISEEQLLELNVRTISKEGKVIDFDKSKLKALENVDGKGNFHIFAIEGIEEGGEIEYTYTITQMAQYFGSEIFQTDVPVMEASIKIVYPGAINYTTKSYNGFPDAVKRFNYHYAAATNIPAMQEEEQSAFSPNLMRLDFKIDSNPQKQNLISWRTIGETYFKQFNMSKGSAKASKLIRNLKINKLSTEEKVQAIEDYLKNNITLTKSSKEEYGDPNFILKNNTSNEAGLIKTYFKCLSAAKIRFNVLICANKYKLHIDKDFAIYPQQSDIIFYFPEVDAFVAPTYANMRLGAAPCLLEGTNAIQLRTDYNSSNRLIYLKGTNLRRISTLSPQQNFASVIANVSVSPENLKAKVDLAHSFQGHPGYEVRFGYLMNKEGEDLENFKQMIVTSALEDAVYENFEVLNEDMTHSGKKNDPLVVKATFETDGMVESAGDDLLVSIGKVIGKQSELYEDKERITDVTTRHPRVYRHEISLEIPKGYNCKGLDQLECEHLIEEDGKLLMRYISHSTIQDGVLKIVIEEEYHQAEMDKSQYDNYRKCVNAAADFNKAVLILSPELSN